MLVPASIMKRFSIVTLFPEFIDSFSRTGIVRRCLDSGLAAIDTVNPRDFAVKRRQTLRESTLTGLLKSATQSPNPCRNWLGDKSVSKAMRNRQVTNVV